MITTAIIFIAGLFLNLIGLIFSIVTWGMPEQVLDAIESGFDKLHYLDFFIPMDDLLTALGIFITFLISWYSLKIFMWLYHIIRHGGDVDLPKLGLYSTARYDAEDARSGYKTNYASQSHKVGEITYHQGAKMRKRKNIVK